MTDLTPQTAAALRALEADIRYNAKRFLHMQALFRWADELAAVLTQEGADTCQFCGQGHGTHEVCSRGITCGWRECPECHGNGTYPAAPTEPRAAEGAGTSVELKRAYAHQQRIRACAAWSDVINQKTGEIDESKAKYAGSCEQQLTKAIDDLANTHTAAAAVPAGGDAESAEWCAQAKLTMQRMFRFLQKIKAPYAVDCREWIDNAEKMLNAAPAPRGGDAVAAHLYASSKVSEYNCRLALVEFMRDVNSTIPLEACAELLVARLKRLVADSIATPGPK